MSQEFNLAEWVRRLGWKRADEPNVTYDVQPVLVLGDQSALTPRYQGPGAVLGGSQASTAGQHSLLRWNANSAGGMIVHGFEATAVGGFNWGIVTGVSVFDTGPVAMNTGNQTQPGAVVTGEIAATLPGNKLLVAATDPSHSVIVGDLRLQPGGLFVRSGAALLFETIQPANTFAGWALIEELPAARAD